MDSERDYKVGDSWCLKCECTGCDCPKRKRLVVVHVDPSEGVVTFKRRGLVFPLKEVDET